MAEWELTSITCLLDLGAELVVVVVAPGTDAGHGLMGRTAERLARGKRRTTPRASLPVSARQIRLGTAESLEAVKVLELEFILAVGLTGSMLPMVGDPDRLARRGVWTHAFAVADRHATLPPGFDAIRQGKALAEVSLVRLSPSGSGQPLEQEWVRVEPFSYRRTRETLTSAAAELAARHLRRDATVRATAPVVRLPKTEHRGEGAAACLMVTLLARAAAEFIRRSLFRQDWNVGVIRRPIADVLAGVDGRDIEWLPKRDGDAFLADPFGIPLPDGTCLLLAEEFVGGSGRGRIVAATIRASSYISPPRPVLELGVHLSYPYVIPSDDGWLFAPETAGAAEVAIYRLVTASGPAQRDGTLLDDFAAVDPTIVEYEGQWWLFATDAARNADGHLHVWYADSARGPWAAHALNPVKCDVRSARPGGTPFIVNGVLFRPAQDNSRTYGGAVVINRIDLLTPVAFAETTVARLVPDPDGPYPSGIHTMSAVGSSVLVDGKRFSLEPRSKMRRLLLRASRRARPRSHRHPR
jgi:hypothetical protein